LADVKSSDIKNPALIRRIQSPKCVNKNTLNIKEKIGVSHRFITLVDDDNVNKSRYHSKSKTLISKPATIQKINDVTLKISKTIKMDLPKLDFDEVYKNSLQVDDNGEENMIESPCPRPKQPAINSYRKSSEKSDGSLEFTLAPRPTKLSTKRKNDYDLGDSDSYSSSDIFDRADNFDDDEPYELFTWSREFDHIVDGTHKQIFDTHNNLLRTKQCDTHKTNMENPYVKYQCLKGYMIQKASTIRKMKRRSVDSTMLTVNTVAKRSMPRKRNSHVNAPVLSATPSKSVSLQQIINLGVV